jgi:hypothetical protein
MGLVLYHPPNPLIASNNVRRIRRCLSREERQKQEDVQLRRRSKAEDEKGTEAQEANYARPKEKIKKTQAVGPGLGFRSSEGGNRTPDLRVMNPAL